MDADNGSYRGVNVPLHAFGMRTEQRWPDSRFTSDSFRMRRNIGAIRISNRSLFIKRGILLNCAVEFKIHQWLGQTNVAHDFQHWRQHDRGKRRTR